MLTDGDVGCTIQRRPYGVSTISQFNELVSEQGRLGQGAEAEGSQTH